MLYLAVVFSWPPPGCESWSVFYGHDTPRRAGQLECGIFLSRSLVSVSCVHIELMPWGQHRRDAVFFSGWHHRLCDPHLTTGTVNPDHSVKVLRAGVYTAKFLFCPL